MQKKILDTSDYVFDASAKTVTFSNTLEFNHILIITNITDNIIIYNFGCSGFGGDLSSKVLTLDYDTTTMSDTDHLQVIVYVEGEDIDSVRLLEVIRKQTEVLDECLDELKECSKYLRKIYNPE